MDKNTLSNYGWIVIAVLVLAVMIALSTPFGNCIKDAVWSTTEGLFDVSENALNVIEPPIDYDKYMRSIAHRGYNVGAPENTLPAYSMAKSMGFNYAECDIAFTSDGVPVLLHDTTINRTARNTDGTELTEDVKIADITYEQATQYDYGVFLHEKYKGTKIPTFEEFIKHCSEIGIHPYIEIKRDTGFNKARAKQLVEIVEKYNMIGKVTWTGEQFNYVQYIVEYDLYSEICMQSYELQTTSTDKWLPLLKTEHNTVIAYCYLGNSTTYDVQTSINTAKSAGIPIHLWAVDSTEYIEKVDPYVSGITSNFLHAGKITYEYQNKKYIKDWEVVRTLNTSDLKHKTSLSYSKPYYASKSTRTSYIGFDIPIESGYVYKFEFDSPYDDTQMGCMFLRGTGYYKYLTDIYNTICLTTTGNIDSGWQSSGYEFEHPYTVGKIIRLTFRKGDNLTVPEDLVTSVTISRKSIQE